MVHSPIWVPSAAQTVWPAVVHEAVEPAGAEEGCCAALGETTVEGTGSATEGETAGPPDGAAGELGFSVGAGAAAPEGTTAATFSCTCRDGRAADGNAAAAADDDGWTADDTLDVPSLSLGLPGTVQPIGVH